MASLTIEETREFFRRLLGKGRIGPVSHVHMQIILDLAHARNRIDNEASPVIRAFLHRIITHAEISSSQIFQDLFVLYALEGKTGGFFCDFGSADGVTLSNSYCLERYFDWRGICAEPARNWHDELRKNRPHAFVETSCVWSRSDEILSFSEARTKELSTISTFRGADSHARKRRDVQTYDVPTISLNDLLTKYEAPADFDYLSMDTEGSELAILESFDLIRWRPKVITVEHNYTPNRNAILKLLTTAGYRRVLVEVSLFDDWYLAPGIDLAAK